MGEESVKKEWLLVPLAFLLLVRILIVRPQLMEWSRFTTEYSPWSRAPVYQGALVPIFAVNGFADRAHASEDPTQKSSFYRNHVSRDGLTDETLANQMHLVSIYPDLNIGEHSASKASPAVDETGIYVGDDSGWFFAFDLGGEVRWKFHIDESLRGIHSTALLYQNRVCFGGYNATFYCLDKRDGKVIWSSRIPSGGYGASPLIVDHDFVTSVEVNRPANGFFARFSLDDGHLIWTTPMLGNQPHSSPALDEGRGALYGGNNNHMIFQVDVKRGGMGWARNLGAEVKDTPLVGPTAIYVTSWSHKLFSLEKAGGQIRWTTNLHGMSQSSPTLIENTIIIGDSSGYLYGIDSSNGKIIWEKKTNFGLKASALGAKLANGKWAAWMACGRDVICALDPLTGKVLGEIGLPGSLTGVPVAFRGEIYLALDFPGGLVKLSPGQETED